MTAGDSKVSDRPFVLPAADGAAAEAVEAVILQGGPGTVSAGTGTVGANTGTAENKTAGNSSTAASAADIKQPEVAAEGRGFVERSDPVKFFTARIRTSSFIRPASRRL